MTGWRSFGASVRGPGHVASGLPNQDAWSRTLRSWGEVVVVSDGVGSRPNAEYGSRAACRAVPRAVQHDRGNTRASLRDIKAHWLEFVAPFDPRDCAATCLYVLRPVSGPITIGVLGDGLAVVTRTDGGIEYVEHSKADSFANITVALSAATREDEWRVAEIDQERVDLGDVVHRRSRRRSGGRAAFGVLPQLDRLLRIDGRRDCWTAPSEGAARVEGPWSL